MNVTPHGRPAPDSRPLAVALETEDGPLFFEIRAASVLREDLPQGEAAEVAAEDAASIWGLPDFVFRIGVAPAGAASREVGDRLLIAGETAAVRSAACRTDNSCSARAARRRSASAWRASIEASPVVHISPSQGGILETMPSPGVLGIWSAELREVSDEEAADAAAELETLGFGAIWIPGRRPDDLERRLRGLLSSTRSLTVATGIVSIWTFPLQVSAALSHAVMRDYPDRFLLGLGVSHASHVREAGLEYRRPLASMIAYLDALDAADASVERVLGALGPRMLGLARDRTSGAHPYLVTAEHTRRARAILGPGLLLAPEQTVLLERDPSRARTVARRWLATYLSLPNYVSNLIGLGFSEDDLQAGGSDRLVDALVVWGDVEAVAARVEEHRAAGADHVALRVLPTHNHVLPREEWRQIAGVLLR